MKSRFISLYQMVLADGIIDATEMETLFRIGQENYGLEPQQINELIKDSNVDVRYPESLDDKVRLLYELGEVAWADGNIDQSEVKLLKTYVIRMGFEESNAIQIADFILEQVKNKVCVDDVLKLIND